MSDPIALGILTGTSVMGVWFCRVAGRDLDVLELRWRSESPHAVPPCLIRARAGIEAAWWASLICLGVAVYLSTLYFRSR